MAFDLPIVISQSFWALIKDVNGRMNTNLWSCCGVIGLEIVEPKRQFFCMRYIDMRVAKRKHFCIATKELLIIFCCL